MNFAVLESVDLGMKKLESDHNPFTNPISQIQNPQLNHSSGPRFTFLIQYSIP